MPSNSSHGSNNIPKWKEVQEEKNRLDRKIELITMRNLAGLVGIVIEKSKSWEDFQNNWHLVEEKLEQEINKL